MEDKPSEGTIKNLVIVAVLGASVFGLVLLRSNMNGEPESTAEAPVVAAALDAPPIDESEPTFEWEDFGSSVERVLDDVRSEVAPSARILGALEPGDIPKLARLDPDTWRLILTAEYCALVEGRSVSAIVDALSESGLADAAREVERFIREEGPDLEDLNRPERIEQLWGSDWGLSFFVDPSECDAA